MTALRSDAARSRARILDAARRRDPHDLKMNEVAREAGVGVGTVYRHFPTTRVLAEALALETIDRLLELARRTAAEPDSGAAFSFFLRTTLALQLEDGGLQAVLLSPEDETDEVRAAKQEIFGTFAAVLDRAKDAGVVRRDLTLDQLAHLVCGIEHAVRLGAPEDRTLMLEVLLAGLLPSA